MAAAETLRAFGEQLRSERQKQRRSLDDIASSIKIHRRHLEAIEAGDLASLPQGPYVMAFVREYARSLNIPLPPEYAPPVTGPGSSSRDPKVISHPAGSPPLSQVAKETARIANTAVKSAVKTVTKTTESVVNLVETGGKEALEVLTSKSLWEEAEDIRRERHGLPPLERKPEPPKAEAPPRVEEAPEKEESPLFAEVTQRVAKARTSKRATNTVIAMLALVFGVVAYFAIRMSHTGGDSASANKEYVPAPLEKPQIPVERKVEKAATPTTAAVPPVKDSLKFVVRATQPVWISIAPDGIPAYKGEMKPGEVKAFRAGTKFVVNIGNQKGVAMEFNGMPLSGLPTIQNSSVVVRDLVLMRDRVLLGGNAVDFHKLTSAPPPPAPKVVASQPNVIPPSGHNAAKSTSNTKAVSNKATNSRATNDKALNNKSTVKSPANRPQNNASTKTPPSKASSMQVKSNSSVSKSTNKPKASSPKKSGGPVIHPVEPVPPSP